MVPFCYQYLANLLHSADLGNLKFAPTPMEPRCGLYDKDSSTLDSSAGKMFRHLVGSLQYLTMTRLNIAYSVNKISQFLCNPRKVHWTALQWICRYLLGTLHASIRITKISKLQLTTYLDADWAGDTLDHRSHGGYLIYLGDNLTSWKFNKQPTVSQSSTEAEYRNLANAAAELNWIASMVKEIGIIIKTPLKLACDNLGANYLARNPIYHGKTKHVVISYHFVREQVSNEILVVEHI